MDDVQVIIIILTICIKLYGKCNFNLFHYESYQTLRVLSPIYFSITSDFTMVAI